MKKKVISALVVFFMAMGILAESLPRIEAKAAIAFLYDKKKPNAMLTTKKAKEVFVGRSKLNIDYNIGGKKKGVKGKWISSNPKIAKVSKSGKITALRAGEVIISFRYKSGKVSKEIKCKLAVSTKATDIKLIPPSNFDGMIEFGTVFSFKSVVTTDPKALQVNPNITHSYLTSYELYMDENLQNPAPSSLATVGETGILKAGYEAGVVYLRAVAKPNREATTGILYSNAIAVTIGHKVNLQDAVIRQTALNQFEISYEEANKITKVELRSPKNNAEISTSLTYNQDPKLLTVTTGQNLTENLKVILIAGDKKDERIVPFSEQKVNEIEFLDTEANLVSFENNKGVAEISYRLLDQFGADVTNDFRFAGKSYAIWDDKTAATITGNKISISLNAEQLFDYTGKLQFTYGGQEVPVTKVIHLKVGRPSEIKEVQIQGVYKRTTNSYLKVMDDKINLPVGSIIGHFGGSSLYNSYPESYYLLVRVRDNKGKDVADIGAGQGKFAVTVSSNTGFELERADNKNEVTSIAPITLDGVSYLTYPVKAAALRAGNIRIRIEVKGKNISHEMEMKVADTTNVSTGNFELRLSGEGKVGIENLISYTLMTSDNRFVTKYEEVIALLGFQDYGRGIVQIPLDSKVISSANYSSFVFKKNQTTGGADLYYTPNLYSLQNGMSQNIETITIMKGTSMEKSVILTVKAK